VASLRRCQWNYCIWCLIKRPGRFLDWIPLFLGSSRSPGWPFPGLSDSPFLLHFSSVSPTDQVAKARRSKNWAPRTQLWRLAAQIQAKLTLSIFLRHLLFLTFFHIFYVIFSTFFGLEQPGIGWIGLLLTQIQ
jgi:hypothetical protein